MTPDIEKVGTLLKRVAAEEVMPRWRQLEEADRRYKANDELVTVADEASEAAISEGLRALLPGSPVVGEEAVAADRSVLDRLSAHEAVWIVDPIDGTTNYAYGRENFVLMTALVRQGQILAAAIYAPVSDRLALAERGQSVTVNGRPCRLASDTPPVGELRGTLHAGQFSSPELAARINARRDRLTTMRTLGSAGMEYLRMVEGGIDYSFFSKLMPWDHAPGCLLLAEAGGIARFSDTQEPYSPLRHSGQGLLLAPDEESWQDLHAILFGPE